MDDENLIIIAGNILIFFLYKYTYEKFKKSLQYWNYSTELNSMKVLELSNFITLFNSNKIKYWKNPKNQKEITINEVILSGKIFPIESTKTIIYEIKDAILPIYQNGEKGKIYKKKNYFNNSPNQINDFLFKTSKLFNNSIFQINMDSNVDVRYALKPQNKEKIKIFNKNFISSIFKKIGGFFGITFTIGISSQNFCVKAEDNINILGEITYYIDKKQFLIKNPKMIINDMTFYKNIIGNKLNFSIIKFLFAGTISLLVSYYVLEKIYNKRRKINEDNHILNYRNKHVFTDEENCLNCSFCKVNQKNVIFLPCKHLACCENCFRKKVEILGECPLCNVRFSERFKIYPV